MVKYGEKLQALRQGKLLTVKEVACLVGIPQSRLSEIERDTRIPTAGQLTRLEQLFGATVRERVKGEK